MRVRYLIGFVIGWLSSLTRLWRVFWHLSAEADLCTSVLRSRHARHLIQLGFGVTSSSPVNRSSQDGACVQRWQNTSFVIYLASCTILVRYSLRSFSNWAGAGFSTRFVMKLLKCLDSFLTLSLTWDRNLWTLASAWLSMSGILCLVRLLIAKQLLSMVPMFCHFSFSSVLPRECLGSSLGRSCRLVWCEGFAFFKNLEG